MVFIDIIQDGHLLILNCHKNSEDGEFFQLIVDSRTREILQAPEYPDMDASVAYSHIRGLLSSGKPIPTKTVAAWG